MLTEVPSPIGQIASDHFGHRLAVIVPVFNEETRVRRSIERLLEAAKADAWSVELILVDDCSSDGSCEVLKELAADNPEHSIKVVQHEVNRGKGAAIRSGLQLVTASVVVIQDADLEYNPRDLSRLVQRIACDDADVVYGSRCLADSVNPRRWSTFAWGVSLLNMIVRILYGMRLTDEATCYKMFRTDDLLRMDLQCERFEFCPEVTANEGFAGSGLVHGVRPCFRCSVWLSC